MLSSWADSFPKLTTLELFLEWDWREDSADPTSFLAPFVIGTTGKYSLQKLRVGLPFLRSPKQGQLDFLEQLLHLHAASLRAVDVIPFYLHSAGVSGSRSAALDQLSHMGARFHTQLGLHNLVCLRVFSPQSHSDMDGLCVLIQQLTKHLRSLRIFARGHKDHAIAPYAGLEHKYLMDLLRTLTSDSSDGEGCLEQLDVPVHVPSTGLLDALNTSLSLKKLCLRFCYLGTADSSEHDEVSADMLQIVCAS